MKKHTEKQPIDDLFARKLGNMSLPPGTNGFERLQMRMGQSRSEVRIVFWKNPVMQRSMAAAACLLLVCLFGWLYLSSDSKMISEKPQIAIRHTSPVRLEKPVKEPVRSSVTKSLPDVLDSNQRTDNERLATVKNASQNKKGKNQSTIQPIKVKTAVLRSEALVRNEPVLAQTKPTKSKASPEVVTPQDVTQINQKTPEQTEQVADNKETAKPIPTAERVLVVTIAEPESLVAAHQAAKASIEEKPVVAVDDKTEKETKAGGLWQQVKRIKQGELFAHRENKSNDDRGLLSRAYDGLKHSLDKDKSVKQ